MKMRVIYALSLIISLALLTGCGGGGGGGGAAPVGITYTGLTNLVTITDTNAQVLTTAALEGGDPVTAIGVFAGVASEGDSPIRHSRLIRFTHTLREAVLHMDVPSAAGDPVASTGPTGKRDDPGRSGYVCWWSWECNIYN